ncbi:MAG: hypothetical protein Q4G44_01295 [Alcaligenaceae bacterium]|nr:hypothetical protein [Alcaligenaceae bacterium]
MNTHRTHKIYLFSMFALAAATLSACKTTPMYTEGDVHFEATCVQGDSRICEQGLRDACAEYDGEVVELKVRRERYISEELKAELRAKGVNAQSVHLICRPPPKAQDEIARQGSNHPDNSAAAQRDNLSQPINLDPNAEPKPEG